MGQRRSEPPSTHPPLFRITGCIPRYRQPQLRCHQIRPLLPALLPIVIIVVVVIVVVVIPRPCLPPPGPSLPPSSKKRDSKVLETEEEIRDRISRFSRNEAAWQLPVEKSEVQGVFQCIKQCQLAHLALSKLVRAVDEGLHSIQPPRRKKVVNYSIFHTPEALR